MYTVVLTLLAALAAMPSAKAEASGNLPPAPKPGSPTYAMLANFTGQYTLTVFVRQSPDQDWTLHTCNATGYGAPCNQPLLYGGSTQEVKIVFTVKNKTASFRTWKNGKPVEVVLRLDYAPASQVDRGWRKKNQAWPGHGWHAKWVVGTVAWNTSGEAVWYLGKADMVTDAVLYPEACTMCVFEDGQKDFCQCDRRNGAANINTVETVVENSITSSMRASAIAMSVFSPLLLIIYAVSDSLYYKKTGKSLRLVHA